MRTEIEHHGVTFDVSYRYTDAPARHGGRPPLDPPEPQESFEVLTYELTDRDEWHEWHTEEPTADRLRAFAKESESALLEDARSRCGVYSR